MTGTKFQLKLTMWGFGPTLPKKGTAEKKQSNKLQAFALTLKII